MIGNIDREKQPAIEAKVNGKGIMFCDPSIHGWPLDDNERNTMIFYHIILLSSECHGLFLDLVKLLKLEMD